MTVRDPIERFISAFNFDKYEKIINGNGGNVLWNTIYSTFSSADDLAQSFLSHDKKKRTLAWQAISESYLHIHLGLSWYLSKELLTKIPIDRFHVIRQEYLAHDLSNFFEKMGVKDKMNTPQKDKDSTFFIQKLNIKEPKKLSFSSKIILASIFSDDYLILNFFKKNNLINEEYSSPLKELNIATNPRQF